jgi:hypothetical protein
MGLLSIDKVDHAHTTANYNKDLEGGPIRMEPISIDILPPFGPSTETNARCKMTKIPHVLYKKDLAIDLSFM